MPIVRKATLTRRVTFKRSFAKALRTNATDAERILWFLLGDRRIDVRFRRQQPIGPYIADFFCPVAKLIVELDGGQHGLSDTAAYDEARTRFLTGRGYQVLRFPNHAIFRSPRSVLEVILQAASERAMRARPLPENPVGIFDPPSRGG